MTKCSDDQATRQLGDQVTVTRQSIVRSASPLKLLLAPFDRYTLPTILGGTIKPGLDGLQTLVHHFCPEVVVQTHDEDKHTRGLVSRLARITPFKGTELHKHDWLAERYHPIPHYQPVTL